MKKGTQKREKRSYRMLGGLTVLSVLVSVMLGLFVSSDACLSGVLGLTQGQMRYVVLRDPTT